MRKLSSLVLFVATLFVFYFFNIYWKFGRPFHQQPVGRLYSSIASSVHLPEAWYHLFEKEIMKNRQDRKIILYWTKFFKTSDFAVGLGRQPFNSCRDMSCITTIDRGLFNESDAVIFHARNLNMNDLPPIGWRRPEQNFIFLLLESPLHTNLSLLRQPVFRDYFNRTMTYRRDSDITYYYGQLKCIHPFNCLNFPRRANESIESHTFNSTWPAIQMDLNSKNQTVAWFVSNCNTKSQRESLVRRLSDSIPVYAYGRCAGRSVTPHRCSNSSDCDLMLSRHYRFYLSMENSLCPDYVTEKLYRPLKHDTVPIVYGGADYSVFLPAGSYVNAMDFNSPERLAEYLNQLMIDDQLYSSYLNWKSEYVVDTSRSSSWCQLCRMLQDPSVQEKSYSDIAGWWSGQTTNQTCIPPIKWLVSN